MPDPSTSTPARKRASPTDKFIKVAHHLYRYSGNGGYYMVIRVEGKLHWKSLKTDKRWLAVQRLKEQTENVTLVDPKRQKTTLQAVIDLYEQKLKSYALKTRQTRQSILKVFRTTWKYGLDVQVKDINPAMLELWLAGLRKTHDIAHRNTTKNEYIRFLRQLFQLAVSSRIIPQSPAAGLKQLRPETPIRTTPTFEQFQAIVATIRKQKYNHTAHATADLVEFMGLAGVGTAECANLRGEHIDFASNRITLYRQKTDTGYTIPIFPQLMPLLEKLKSQGRIRNGQPVFQIRDPKKALKAACKELAYPGFSPRSLRRCFITRVVELGVDFKTIASWQGHHDGGVLIAKTYSHLRSEHSDAMAKKVKFCPPSGDPSIKLFQAEDSGAK